MSSQTVTVLQRLLALFGLTALLKDMGDLLEDDYASRQQASLIRQQQYALLRELRPDAVALVDSFGFEDYLLNSSLGRSESVPVACRASVCERSWLAVRALLLALNPSGQCIGDNSSSLVASSFSPNA